MDARSEQGLGASDFLDCPMHPPSQVGDVPWSRIGQCPFGLSPDKLIRVEFRSIGRERIDVEARMPLDKDTDEGTAMDRAAIPQQDHVTSQVSEQVPEKADDLHARDIGSVKPRVEPKPAPARRNSEAGDGRDAEPLIPMPELGSLSPGSPRVMHVGNEQEPTFVEENQMGFPLKGVFLYGANDSASSGRWLLRCAPRPAAGAFGRSSPSAPSVAIHGRDGSAPRTAGQSCVRSEAGSTRPSNNRLPADRPPSTEPTESFGMLRVVEAAPESAGHARPPCLPADVLEPSGRPS